MFDVRNISSQLGGAGRRLGMTHYTSKSEYEKPVGQTVSLSLLSGITDKEGFEPRCESTG